MWFSCLSDWSHFLIFTVQLKTKGPLSFPSALLLGLTSAFSQQAAFQNEESSCRSGNGSWSLSSWQQLRLRAARIPNPQSRRLPSKRICYTRDRLLYRWWESANIVIWGLLYASHTILVKLTIHALFLLVLQEPAETWTAYGHPHLASHLFTF